MLVLVVWVKAHDLVVVLLLLRLADRFLNWWLLFGERGQILLLQGFVRGITCSFFDLLFFVLRRENKLLIFVLELKVLLRVLFVVALLVIEAADSLRDAEWVDLGRGSEVGQVRDKVAVLHLLLNELIGVDSTRLLQV